MSNKILIGTIFTGFAKSYALPKWIEMAEACFKDHDVVAVVDQLGKTPFKEIKIDLPPADAGWADTICEHGKEVLRKAAIEGGYDFLLWQGIDCYYTRKSDFDFFLATAERGRVISALTAGRNMPDYPVCREFVVEKCGRVTREQKEFPQSFLKAGGCWRVFGYPSSDATILSRELLGVSWLKGYRPWQHRMMEGKQPNLAADEFRFWRMTQAGANIWINSDVRTYHAHDVDLMVARFPNELKPLEELSWS